MDLFFKKKNIIKRLDTVNRDRHTVQVQHSESAFNTRLQNKGTSTTENSSSIYLCFSFVCEGKSRLEYCFDNAERSPSPFPRPPFAVSHVGLAAVVIFPRFL